MKIKYLLCIGIISFTVTLLSGQSKEDTLAITNTIKNYAEGFFEGNAERMDKALYEDLAKRWIYKNEKGETVINRMSAMQLYRMTKYRGETKNVNDPEELVKGIQIFHIHNDMASAYLSTEWFCDYIHLGRINGEWKIINVLWSRPDGDK